jgi:hypothetical protein
LITKKVESLMWASLWKTIILSMPVEKCNWSIRSFRNL